MQLHPLDNVAVHEDKQKYALSPIAEGENVIKYGFPIGHAIRDIAIGEKVDPSNLRSNLEGQDSWVYTPFTHFRANVKQKTFMGYLRKNGEVGIRNELWIVLTLTGAELMSDGLTIQYPKAGLSLLIYYNKVS